MCLSIIIYLNESKIYLSVCQIQMEDWKTDEKMDGLRRGGYEGKARTMCWIQESGGAE